MKNSKNLIRILILLFNIVLNCIGLYCIFQVVSGNWDWEVMVHWTWHTKVLYLLLVVISVSNYKFIK